MSLGSVAGFIAAIAFVLLVGVLAVPLVKLGRAFDSLSKAVEDLGVETATSLRGITGETVPLLHETTLTVSTANAQLARVDAITGNVADVTANVSALTATLATTFGSPVIRIAAFSYGVRRAMSGSRAQRRARRTRP